MNTNECEDKYTLKYKDIQNSNVTACIQIFMGLDLKFVPIVVFGTTCLE